MKRIIVVFAAALMALSPGAALAEESPVKVTVGLKSWYNSWTHSVDYTDGTSQSWNNGSAFMIGPSVNVKAGGFFVGGSYLKSVSDYKANDWYTVGDSMKFERKDMDMTMGYMFVPYVGVFLGLQGHRRAHDLHERKRPS